MSRGIEEEEWEQTEARRDTELTISPLMLLGAFAGLILLCSLCFGFGYATGRHYSAEPASVLTGAAAQTPPPVGGLTSKPMAAGQAETQAAPDAAATDTSAPTTAADAVATPQAATRAESDPAPQPRANPVAESAIRSAFSPTTNAAQPAIAKPVQSALSSGSVLMVQIAAVSRPEDADVLVNAL